VVLTELSLGDNHDLAIANIHHIENIEDGEDEAAAE